MGGHGSAGFSRVGLLLLGAGGRAVWAHCPQHKGSRSRTVPAPHNSVLCCLGDKGVGALLAARGFRCRERPGLPVHPPSLHTCPGSPGVTVHIPQIPHFPTMEMGSFLGMFNAGNKALVLISCGEGRELIAGWPRRGQDGDAGDRSPRCGCRLWGCPEGRLPASAPLPLWTLGGQHACTWAHRAAGPATRLVWLRAGGLRQPWAEGIRWVFSPGCERHASGACSPRALGALCAALGP